MSRRPFRRLEIEPGIGTASDAPDGAVGPAPPVFRRSLELDGDDRLDPGEAPAAPEQATAEPHAALPEAPPVPAPPGATGEPGFGAVLASGALTACIFALVSIPVRAAFASGFGEGGALRGGSELLAIVALTLVLRRLFAGPLRAL